jgi:hypothetical protein
MRTLAGIPLGLFALLLLAVGVVVAQTPPTCPAAPIWSSTPAWATYAGDDTDYGHANNLAPAPLSDLTDVVATVVDSTSPYAKAHGTQIYVSGVLNSVPTVVRVQGGDAFGPDSTNVAFTANWTAAQLRQLTVDQQTGEVYGVTTSYDIVHLVSNGTLETILTLDAFNRLYWNLSDTFPVLNAPTSIAFDSASNLFIGVESYELNPMIAVYQPAANGQAAKLTKIAGSGYYNIGPYGRVYAPQGVEPQPTLIQFAHGYLHFFDSGSGVVVRTQFPYSTFGSAADFDQNRLVAGTSTNFARRMNRAIVHDATGTVFGNLLSVDITRLDELHARWCHS